MFFSLPHHLATFSWVFIQLSSSAVKKNSVCVCVFFGILSCLWKSLIIFTFRMIAGSIDCCSFGVYLWCKRQARLSKHWQHQWPLVDAQIFKTNPQYKQHTHTQTPKLHSLIRNCPRTRIGNYDFIDMHRISDLPKDERTWISNRIEFFFISDTILITLRIHNAYNPLFYSRFLN